MLLRITAFSFFSFIVFVLLSVDMGWKWAFLGWGKMVPFEDKTIHFVFMGLFSFFVNLLLEARRSTVFSFSVLSGSLLVLTITTIEEFSQLFLANRNFELLDLLCNVCGIFLFGKIAEQLVKYKPLS